ncbi:Por secretion system C-terminal sorting domain-containing protein [Chitinophaga rupis]|uniref:Glucanase n=1 Tax=Chitinophaga rupis TaxID=573321 RepID=A0A1H7Y4C9_9BACT|nr:glycosyl hydrolase family 8 [Chitinophaga rupis]SEM40188.1 Por secretion system C-terminal sorting domain-containing protein [Chitinophaga rupis]
MRKPYAILATGMLCIAGLIVQAQKKPFPQAVSYPGCIKPNNVTQADMNTSVASFYDYWKSKYLKNNLASLPGGYYIKGEISGDADGYTPLGSSEGQGYGMVITVLMAGHDANARTIYDGLFKTARAYRSSINSNIMGWVVADNASAQGHFDSATDGDIDIAYSLILAHYQWGSDGAINYLNEAKKMITNGIKAANVTTTNRLNLGDWDSKSALNTRPSDWMLSHMRAFYQETNDAAWLNLINNLYSVYNQFSATYSPSTGLISDFVVKNPPEPAPKNFIDEGPQTNEYNYNACRVPLRVVMDYALYGSTSAQTISNKIATWIIQKSGGNPASIRDGYQLNGTTSGTDPEAVFVAPFVAAAVANSANQAFVNSGWNFLKTKKSGYYSDSYSLLCQLFISGNWWKPEAGTTPPPACVPASASSDDGNVATNVLDNDLNTRWSASGDGQWIQLCLDNPVSVTGVDIAFYQGNTRRALFDVQTSTDGLTFTNAATGLQSSGTSLALESFTFAAKTAKYVRILGHGNNVSAWNSYTEVKVRTGTQSGQQVTLSAAKDAYVRNGVYADSAYGALDPVNLISKLNSTTTTGNDRQAYLGFDLSSVSGTITSAVLKVYGHQDDNRVTNVPVGAYPVANTTWTEAGITWNNKPAPGATALATATVTDSIGRYYSWDITAYVQSEKAAGRSAISLALLNGLMANPRTLWNSKETGSNAPQLVITTTSTAKTAARQAFVASPSDTHGDKLQQVSVFPNPLSSNATVAFTLQQAGPVHLAVYNTNGEVVKVLANEQLPAGRHTRTFAPGNMPGGLYVLKLVHNGKVSTVKLVKQ